MSGSALTWGVAPEIKHDYTTQPLLDDGVIIAYRCTSCQEWCTSKRRMNGCWCDDCYEWIGYLDEQKRLIGVRELKFIGNWVPEMELKPGKVYSVESPKRVIDNQKVSDFIDALEDYIDNGSSDSRKVLYDSLVELLGSL